MISIGFIAETWNGSSDSVCFDFWWELGSEAMWIGDLKAAPFREWLLNLFKVRLSIFGSREESLATFLELLLCLSSICEIVRTDPTFGSVGVRLCGLQLNSWSLVLDSLVTSLMIRFYFFSINLMRLSIFLFSFFHASWLHDRDFDMLMLCR